MYRVVFIIASLTSSLVLAQDERAGPFGIYMGMPLEQLDNTKDCTPPIGCNNDDYRLASVPSPHAAFPMYFVTANAKAGVCQISAISHDVPTAEYEDYYRAIVSDMKLRYGRRYSAAFLEEYEDGTAYRVVNWIKEDEDASWPNVIWIQLKAMPYPKNRAPEGGAYSFVIIFRFSNENECRFSNPLLF